MRTNVQKHKPTPAIQKPNDRIQVLLRERGSNAREFAEQIGIPYLRFRKLACGADTSPELRGKIEAALGYPVFSNEGQSD